MEPRPRSGPCRERVGWLPKACEECLWRSLTSQIVPGSASEQADNLSLGTKLCCHPQSAPHPFSQPRAWEAEPDPSLHSTPGG